MRRRPGVRRRWPHALLGAALGVVVAVVPAGSSASATAGPAHAALSAGHLSEALLVVEHPRTHVQLPAAVAAPAASGPVGPARWSVTRHDHILAAATVTPPAAIRGPPV